ncbi:hypothetical protein ANANG_G00061010 [Anguilla anguilla]|uniref:TNFR-Cys domain-containing protein n=1 Tax=Anguilla anguilla TaxID=7936 RepID=A0A9D3MT92_ANGAN|nr:hypothetical protein ANANG_G00061010 [Anguilla anguilla]
MSAESTCLFSSHLVLCSLFLPGLPPQLQPPGPARPSPASQSAVQLCRRSQRNPFQRHAKPDPRTPPHQPSRSLLQACPGSYRIPSSTTPSRIPDHLLTNPHGPCFKPALKETKGGAMRDPCEKCQICESGIECQRVT